MATSLLAAVLVTAELPTAAGAVQGRLLSTAAGHSIIVRGHNIGRVAVGDAHIAGVVPLDKTQIVVNAKNPGETTIFVWDGGVRESYELTVTDNGLDQLVQALRTAIDLPDVRVATFGGLTVIVSGKVADITDFDHVESVLKRFNGIKFRTSDNKTSEDEKIPFINAVTVDKPLGDLQDQIASVPDAKNLRVDLDADGNVVVSGRVRDRQQEQDVVDKVNGLAGAYLKTDGKVIDRLAMDATSQVDVKVDVLEVDKTAQSQLGLRLQSAQPGGISGNGTAIPPYAVAPAASFVAVDSPVNPGVPGKPFNIGTFTRISLLAPTLDLLISEGHARRLSSPNLMTKPGKEATFLVGGEIPIPVSNGLGTISIDYKEYGVKLKVTPTITADGSVDDDITPEVSDLDFADAINVNGFVVPALKTSRIQTDVTTQDGESIVMGGLLRRIEQKNVLKIPLLGDIPILGQLFRSTAYQRTDTDVVFVLTPTIVTSRRAVPNTASSYRPMRRRTAAYAPQQPQAGPTQPSAPGVAAPPPSGATPPRTSGH
ncbi:MAG: pilus assembly protein N-terminal domain-containing protein [Candidatus Eremiobacteraeota bacterium]|nr:pilus assembly protein N-terminal domain-containing protein [Candidatus Eremiobacteraeota bacterium]MBC5821688.1 pilus assembly protein N-terminal domain-containing protein [Candidatus Eremiobacteraeota bacterium]